MSKADALTLQPACRQSLGETVAASLREAIFCGQLKPGQRIVEPQIADGMRVSRAPVRDALACLEQEGLLQRTTHRSAVVRRLTAKDVEEIWSLRSALDELAVRLAIHKTTPAHFTQLEKNLGRAAVARTPEQLALLDLDFHEILVRCADHQRLLACWMDLRSQVRLLMVHRNLADPDTLGGTIQGHAELLDAIRAKDESRAVALIRQHVENQRTWLLSHMPERLDEQRTGQRKETV